MLSHITVCKLINFFVLEIQVADELEGLVLQKHATNKVSVLKYSPSRSQSYCVRFMQ